MFKVASVMQEQRCAVRKTGRDGGRKKCVGSGRKDGVMQKDEDDCRDKAGELR